MDPRFACLFVQLLALVSVSIQAIVPNLRKNLPYDPVRDFVPISRLATASNVWRGAGNSGLLPWPSVP